MAGQVWETELSDGLSAEVALVGIAKDNKYVCNSSEDSQKKL